MIRIYWDEPTINLLEIRFQWALTQLVIDRINYDNLHLSVLQVGMLVIHSKLRSITLVATKVHVILRRFVVLTWMHDITKSV
jgi:hypothetical protein